MALKATLKLKTNRKESSSMKRAINVLVRSDKIENKDGKRYMALGEGRSRIGRKFVCIVHVYLNAQIL